MALSPDQFTEQLHELEGRLRVSLTDDPGAAPTQAQWQHFFAHITPAELYAQIQKAAGADNHAKLEISLNPDAETCSVVARHNVGFDDDKSYIEFRFSYPDRAELVGAFFPPETQGKSMAKHYMATLSQLAKDIGRATLETSTQDTGGYSWAAFGFAPADKDTWKSLTRQMKDRFVQGGECVKFGSTSFPLLPEEKTIIQHVLDTDFEHSGEILQHLTRLKRIIGTHEGTPLTVGKAMLLETKWNGILPLDDQHPNYAYFRHYVLPATEPAKSIGA